MIERCQSFKTSTGKKCDTIEEAQREELFAILRQPINLAGADKQPDLTDDQILLLVLHLVVNSAKVVDILTTTATSIPRARKANGHVRTRRTKAQIEAIAASVALANRVAEA